ncbi:MAG: PilZ domain-containing protein [Pseudomonadota bacterium]
MHTEVNEKAAVAAIGDTFEIIHVISDTALVNSSWRLSSYATSNKQPLRPGFYFVLWPEKAVTRNYDANAHYFGPFQTKSLANQLKNRGISRGIIRAVDNNPLPMRLDQDTNQPEIFVAPDRRSCVRRPLSTQGLLVTEGLPPIKMQTVDVSMGGLGATTSTQLAVGQLCMVTFDLQLRGKPRGVAAVAEVVYSLPVWQDNFKTGLRFIEIDASGTGMVEEYTKD